MKKQNVLYPKAVKAIKTLKVLLSAAVCLSAALPGAAEANSYRVKVIFDTDMFTDIDDAGALACLHALADAGECEILATVSSCGAEASVGAIEIINRYYGRPEIPVGAPKNPPKLRLPKKCSLSAHPAGGGCNGFPGHDKYRKLLADYPDWFRYADAACAPDATEVYRRVLSAQSDRSVVVCTVGFMTNIRRLLESAPDAISPLDGKTLVARKVKRWVVMACQYPYGGEFNAKLDAESTRIALENWPGEVVFSDFRYGVDCFAGRAVTELDVRRNPVRDLFAKNMPSKDEICRDRVKWFKAGYTLAGRSAWDESAVLLAVRGTQPYFNVERGTFRMVGDDGENEWEPDSENGRHLRITERMPKAEVGRIIDELMTRKPLK